MDTSGVAARGGCDMVACVRRCGCVLVCCSGVWVRRCLLECNDISGAAAGLRDSLGPRNDEAAAAVVAKAGDVDPLVHAAVRRCCAVATPEPRS